MRRIRELSIKIYIIIISLYRTLFKWNLGEHVYIKGFKGKWILYQGVNHPYWKASLIRDADICKTVHEKDMHKVWEWYNIRGTYNSCVKFYMNYWYDLWVDNC